MTFFIVGVVESTFRPGPGDNVHDVDFWNALEGCKGPRERVQGPKGPREKAKGPREKGPRAKGKGALKGVKGGACAFLYVFLFHFSWKH